MDTPNPDKKSIMMYLMCLFQSLPHAAAEAAEAAAVADAEAAADAEAETDAETDAEAAEAETGAADDESVELDVLDDSEPSSPTGDNLEVGLDFFALKVLTPRWQNSTR